MDVNVREIRGNWDLGYSLDKHTIRSTPIGENAYGHMQFHTVRPPAGEALYQLKYCDDYSQIPIIAAQLSASLGGLFQGVSLVVPMPPSKHRQRQPVVEIAHGLAQLMGVPCREDLLVKVIATPTMKDIASREERAATLLRAFACRDVLSEGLHNVLIVDDLYDTGSSLEAATQVLKGYPKIGRVYVATVTRRR